MVMREGLLVLFCRAAGKPPFDRLGPVDRVFCDAVERHACWVVILNELTVVAACHGSLPPRSGYFLVLYKDLGIFTASGRVDQPPLLEEDEFTHLALLRNKDLGIPLPD